MIIRIVVVNSIPLRQSSHFHNHRTSWRTLLWLYVCRRTGFNAFEIEINNMPILYLISHLNFKTPQLYHRPKQCSLLFHWANEKKILILNLKIVNILTLQVWPKKKIKILLHSFQFLYFLYQKKKASQYIHFAFKYLKSRKERVKHATALVLNENLRTWVSKDFI